MGGLGTLRAGKPGDVAQFAGQVHPNLFRFLAQHPKETQIFQNQPTIRGGASGLFDRIRPFPRNEVQANLGSDIAMARPSAPPGSAFIGLPANPNRFAPSHEGLHVVDWLKGLLGFPPSKATSALGKLATEVPMLGDTPAKRAGEHAIERMAESSYNAALRQGLFP